MTSFVTCVKLGRGYEDYAERLKVYVENIVASCPEPFEIIIVEEKTDSFILKQTEWDGHVRIIEYTPSYPNPHGYAMIEAFAKNVGIYEAIHPYVCVTNADVFFDAAFFKQLKFLKPNTFYRYRQYEVPVPSEWSWACVQKSMTSSKWVNPQIMSGTVQGIGYKSGDVMLMHRDGWRQIKGYPENEVWVHSDLIVCVVVSNNGIAVEIPEAGVYTYEQTRVMQEHHWEISTALEYSSRITTN